jgi:hypothetical protein
VQEVSITLLPAGGIQWNNPDVPFMGDISGYKLLATSRGTARAIVFPHTDLEERYRPPGYEQRLIRGAIGVEQLPPGNLVQGEVFIDNEDDFYGEEEYEQGYHSAVMMGQNNLVFDAFSGRMFVVGKSGRTVLLKNYTRF